MEFGSFAMIAIYLALAAAIFIALRVLYKYPKKKEKILGFLLLLPNDLSHKITFWATPSGTREPFKVSGIQCFNKDLITKVSVCTC